MTTTYAVSLVGASSCQDHVFGLRAALEHHPRYDLLERPASTAADQPTDPLSIVTEDGQLFPVLTQRFQPAVRSARTAVASGRLGLPWNVQADLVIAGGVESLPAPPLLSLAADPLDVITETLGLPVRRVMARAHGPADAPAQLSIHADHDKGVTSTVVVSCPTALADTVKGGVARQRYRISGSHGVLLVDATKPGLTLRTQRATTRRWSAPGAVDGLLDAIAAELDGAAGSAPGPSEVAALGAVLVAVRQSLNQRVPVPVNQPQ